MDEETAKTIVVAITAIGALVWLAGLGVMLRASRERQARATEGAEKFDVVDPAGPNTTMGGADVDGNSDVLAATFVEQLARAGLGPFGPVKIVSRERGEVAFEAAGTAIGTVAYGGSGFRRGKVQFRGHGSQTRIDYIIETSSRGAILLAVGWVVLALGLVALVAAPWIAFTYLLPRPDLRPQAVQTVQMVHFLWPPFLFASLSRQPTRIIRAQMDALVTNLPYIR